MKKVILMIIIAVSLITACSKDSSTPTGIYGTYSGTLTNNGQSIACKSTINYISNSTVGLQIVSNGSSAPYLSGITAVNIGKDSCSLSYSDASGYLTGHIYGNQLFFIIVSGSITDVFTGSK